MKLSYKGTIELFKNDTLKEYSDDDIKMNLIGLGHWDLGILVF